MSIPIVFDLSAKLDLDKDFNRVVYQVRALRTESATATAGMISGLGEVVSRLDQLVVASARAGSSMSGLGSAASATGNIFKQVFSANILSDTLEKAISGIKDALLDLGKAIIEEPASYEQAQIAFTSMMHNDSAAADELLKKIQSLANITPFHFDEEAQAARSMMALGVAAKDVVPMLYDIDTAVAALGGGDQNVARITAALAKMESEGKVVAIFMNELTRDGFPAWDALAQYMGKTVGQVRELAREGSIAADVFDKAFHTYVVENYGDALYKQSQTFKGLMSTVEDLGQLFERTFGLPIIQTMEEHIKGAVAALQDPKVVAVLHQWGVEVAAWVGWILDGIAALAQFFGLPVADFSNYVQQIADLSHGLQGDWTGAAIAIDEGAQAAKRLDNAIADTQEKVQKTRDAVAAVDDMYQRSLQSTRNAQAVYDDAADNQLANLRDQAKVIDYIYSMENKRAELAKDQTKLDRDRRLGQDIFSNAGQAARGRILDEEAAVDKDIRDINQARTKFKLDQEETAVQNAKRLRDQEFQATVRRIEAEKLAYDQEQAAVIRVWEASIREMQKQKKQLEEGPDTTKWRAAGDDIDTRYQKFVASWRAAGDDVATRYQNIADGKTIIGSDPPKSGLFRKIFGTQEEHKALAMEFTSSILNGVSLAIDKWAAGHGSPLMNALMGGKNFQDAFNNWVGQVGAVEDIGGAAAKGVRQALGLDLPNRPAGAGPQSNASRNVGGSNAAANPFDPDSWNPFSPNNPLWQTLTEPITHTQEKMAATSVRQRGKPTYVPTGQDPSGHWEATGKSYTDGTTDWTWVSAATTNYRTLYGGGRASGGPVTAGTMYEVVEPGGPSREFFVPSTNGTVQPGFPSGPMSASGTAQAGGRGVLTIEHLCPECLQRQIVATVDSMTQQIDQNRAGYLRTRLM